MCCLFKNQKDNAYILLQEEARIWFNNMEIDKLEYEKTTWSELIIKRSVKVVLT